MKNVVSFTALIGMIACVGIVSSTSAQVGYDSSNLGGRIFAITGEYRFVADIGLPFAEGDTFQNCYTFDEDEAPGNALDSGSWSDPLFPAPGAAVPGVWVQHAKTPSILYTATSEDGAGLTLTQNGTVRPVFAEKNVRLTAYSTVALVGLGVIVEVLSKGYQVEECPYELPQPDA